MEFSSTDRRATLNIADPFSREKNCYEVLLIVNNVLEKSSNPTHRERVLLRVYIFAIFICQRVNRKCARFTDNTIRIQIPSNM